MNQDKVVNTQKMTEFAGNLAKFNKAMASANTEIDVLLNTPGIENEKITSELQTLKTKLSTMSSDWNRIANEARKNLNLSIESLEETQAKIIKTLGTN